MTGGQRSQGDRVARALEFGHQLKAARLSYLAPSRMEALVRCALRVESDDVPGSFIEAGCALGGSAILLCSLKRPQRPMSVFDVFGMIPPPSDRDGDDVHERYDVIRSGESPGIRGDVYYGYRSDLLAAVTQSFRDFGFPTEQFNVELVPGLIDQTFSLDGPVALAHIDVDWFDPVSICLDRAHERLSVGGGIVVDDYFDWSGCRDAVDLFLGSLPPGTYQSDHSGRNLVLTRFR